MVVQSTDIAIIFVYLIVCMDGREMNLCRFVVLCNSIACVYIATMLRGLKRHDQVLKAYSCMFYESFIHMLWLIIMVGT